eukprot:4716769-Pyramimonas_sp.AAC.1
MFAAGELVPGVMVGDMGRKTLGNDLDNAWIMFNDVAAPYSALLDKVTFGHIRTPASPHPVTFSHIWTARGSCLTTSPRPTPRSPTR